MLDEKDLQAIAQLMDAKLAHQKQDIMSETKGLLAQQKQEIMSETKGLLAQQKQEILDESTRRTKLLLDTEVTTRFNLLAEGQQTILEKLERLDDMEVMDTRINALEAMVKKLNREMEKLKRAQ
ncbi:MAG: hypothetical protein E7G43_15435 [Flavonifractor plautii]|jgi:hypothetical protein|uniref:hypothetical protein n=1 Tax=uncultured Flavonifractor sp. TaxID=1193534 RepID=UPI001DCBB9A1|nr:hypothetical protein [uncultured Flavonifractor sp.]MBS6216670.1 hypothetical protein [Clostridiales bacterium]MBS6533541.1 hypothetical protein [Oscillospiraceae bacterium]MDU3012396.1 hypothetical protein [Flavonifractor plautii]MDU3781332.1 hypothetical protein [Flavonifractor plautii]